MGPSPLKKVGQTGFEQSFSGWEPKKLWLQRQDGTFEECAFSDGFESRADGRALIAQDLDGDGHQEMLMLNRAKPRLQLFVNEGTPGNAMELRLRATKGHPEASTATVKVRTAAGTRAFPVLLTRGYVSSVDPTVHVGLGTETQAEVEVTWRPGVTESFGALQAGHRWALTEGGAKDSTAFAARPPRADVPKLPLSLEQAGRREGWPAHGGAALRLVVQALPQRGAGPDPARPRGPVAGARAGGPSSRGSPGRGHEDGHRLPGGGADARGGGSARLRADSSPSPRCCSTTPPAVWHGWCGAASPSKQPWPRWHLPSPRHRLLPEDAASWTKAAGNFPLLAVEQAGGQVFAVTDGLHRVRTLPTFSQSRGMRCVQGARPGLWSPEAETWNSNRSAWSEANWKP